MSAIEKINQLSHRIFNTSVTEQNVARSSNPFAASNFQKNILTEDVFESSNEKEKNKVTPITPLKEEKKVEVHPSVEVYTSDEFDDPLIKDKNA